MRILLVGGGSGGHVTPLKAVAEVLRTHQDVDIAVVSDKRFETQTKQIFKDVPKIPIKTIFSGKLRRYNGKSLLWHIVHLPTLLLNIRDMFYTAIGVGQSFLLLRRTKVDIIFCKGGFVCLPVGMAAHLLKIPFVIHDSDTHAGLTNRILARWSYKIATGMPSQYYHYDVAKMVYTGIPVNKDLRPLNKSERGLLKKELGFNEKPLLLVTGGGLGSLKLNMIFCAIAERVLSEGWQVIHITGAKKSEAVERVRSTLSKELQAQWQIKEFVPITPYVLASDYIISRTGASAMQEYANAKKTVITIPGKHLSGGHQIKNAEMFKEANSAVALDEDELEKNPAKLAEAVLNLAGNAPASEALAAQLYEQFAKPKAAEDLAELLLRSVSP
jgi:UDP-N-acetylglucosamine--N-acetylmuramyl-(pentapeptide) pyrophosphoryl-undecaprenol N-acetylglucosamine transferase